LVGILGFLFVGIFLLGLLLVGIFLLGLFFVGVVFLLLFLSRRLFLIGSLGLGLVLIHLLGFGLGLFFGRLFFGLASAADGAIAAGAGERGYLLGDAVAGQGHEVPGRHHADAQVLGLVFHLVDQLVDLGGPFADRAAAQGQQVVDIGMLTFDQVAGVDGH